MKRLMAEEHLQHQQKLYDMNIEYYKELETLDDKKIGQISQILRAERESKSNDSMKIIRIDNPNQTEQYKRDSQPDYDKNVNPLHLHLNE